MAYAPNGDLFSKLEKAHKEQRHIPEDTIRKWLYQLCLALEYIGRPHPPPPPRWVTHATDDWVRVGMDAEWGWSREVVALWVLRATLTGDAGVCAPLSGLASWGVRSS